MKDLLITAGLTVIVVATLWGLTFLFDFFRAPATLHREQEEKIGQLEGELALSNSKHPHEEHRETKVKVWLETYPKLRPAVQLMLDQGSVTHLDLEHNEIHPHTLVDALNTGKGIIKQAPGGAAYIVPAYEIAVRNVLYPPT